MKINIEENMNYKLNEAKYNLERMIEEQERFDITRFEYAFSSFTASIRSVLQFAHKYDSKKYDLTIEGLKYKKYFTQIRNTNIHERPVKSSKMGRVTIPVSITVTTNGDIISPSSPKIEEQTLVQEDYFIGEGQMDDSELGFYSLIELSQKYVEEIESFITDFLN